MIKGFRDFILRGNVVDLAVAVIIGTAFGLVVAAFTKGIIMQFVAAIVKTPDFDKLAFMPQRDSHQLRSVPHRLSQLPDRRFRRLLLCRAAGHPSHDQI